MQHNPQLKNSLRADDAAVNDLTSAIEAPQPRVRGSLRQRVLTWVGALVLVSLFGSSLSLYRMTEVSQSLEVINRFSVPLSRMLVQVSTDSELYRREFEKRLGASHWTDPRWKAQTVPDWAGDLLDAGVLRVEGLVHSQRKALQESLGEPAALTWESWIGEIKKISGELKGLHPQILAAWQQSDLQKAGNLHNQWVNQSNLLSKKLSWGTEESERILRSGFGKTQGQVSQLRTGLEMILIVVVAMSLLLLWLGERALRPLTQLTELARGIASRGLKREDKVILPEIGLGRDDEVGQLTREFHRMATALLEREKIVETQTVRLQDQYRLLREISELNQNILQSIDSVLIVSDPQGLITRLNSPAEQWLGQPAQKILGTSLRSWEVIRRMIPAGELQTVERIAPKQIGDQSYSGAILPLRDENSGATHGTILVVKNVTDELELASRLDHAEKMAAVGRLSAQVAHEVRNPLHSIGLEAELALEMAESREAKAQFNLKQSLQSILRGVERLDKITENYLKLSRLSSGQRSKVDLCEVLESVLATYSAHFEAERVRVQWTLPHDEPLEILGDRDLLEQAVGNLVKNAIQAVREYSDDRRRQVELHLTRTADRGARLTIRDFGCGISEKIRSQLYVPFVTTKADGTGLGLSFVKRVVEDHGGSVTCASPEVGAQFELDFGGAARAIHSTR